MAFDLLSNTSANVFLTGKAGTGKTTFLQRLKTECPKRMIVVAPTGVAAINAGGVTIHSFFQLSLDPFVPGYVVQESKKFQFAKAKQNVIRTLDLLVIDEISMVRADVLDAIDDKLRTIRRNPAPFGGVQLLMIGDMQQLPPVTTEQELELLSRYYPSLFFFHSKALSRIEYCSVELKKVYRQTDSAFVSLLNSVREGCVTDDVLNTLNQRYQPDFCPSDNEHYIRLTTHKHQANSFNQSKLDSLPGAVSVYKATVTGNFPSTSYPTDDELRLKVGAQVMFVKNDTSPDKMYYNGKIGVVKTMSLSDVSIYLPDDDKIITVGQQKWTVNKYETDEETKEIKTVEDGAFLQLPLRLAWTITIHKSQGLTFDKVIVEAANSFAHGQVYVALSRCRSLEGLVLSSPLSRSSMFVENEIRKFVSDIKSPSQSLVEQMKVEYHQKLLTEQFDFKQLLFALKNIERVFDEFLYKQYPTNVTMLKTLVSQFETEIYQVGVKFQNQIIQLEQSQSPIIDERATKGAVYFSDKLETLHRKVLPLVRVVVVAKETSKRLDEAEQNLMQQLDVKISTLRATKQGFSVSSYLNAKAVAMLQEEDTKKNTAKSTVKVDADNVRYPLFYTKLKAWRAEMAAAEAMPVYIILSQRAFAAIIEMRPRSEAELMMVSGVGPSHKKYFSDILNLTNDDSLFAVENENYVKMDKPTKTPEKKKSASSDKTSRIPSYEVTYQMLQEGKTIDQISEERGIGKISLFEHVATLIEQGKVDVYKFVATDKIDMVVSYMRTHPKQNKLKPIFESLDAKVSYDDIKMALAYMKSKEKN